MSYKISVRVFQTNHTAFYSIAEKTALAHCNWTESKDEHVLCMPNSGSSGTLRFLDDATGDSFIVTLGVRNYKRWCDIVTNLRNEQAYVTVHPECYKPGNRAQARERVLTAYSVANEKGKSVGELYGSRGQRPQGEHRHLLK